MTREGEREVQNDPRFLRVGGCHVAPGAEASLGWSLGTRLQECLECVEEVKILYLEGKWFLFLTEMTYNRKEPRQHQREKRNVTANLKLTFT